MLRACPRCTQVLPMDAAFCRRCGAEVALPEHPSSKLQIKKVSILTPLLAALLVSGLILAAFVFVHVGQVVPTVQPVQSSSPTYYTNVPAQPVYPDPVNSEAPVYAPVVVRPVYPNPPGFPIHHDPIYYHEQRR